MAAKLRHDSNDYNYGANNEKKSAGTATRTNTGTTTSAASSPKGAGLAMYGQQYSQGGLGNQGFIYNQPLTNNFMQNQNS